MEKNGKKNRKLWIYDDFLTDNWIIAMSKDEICGLNSKHLNLIILTKAIFFKNNSNI